MGLTLEENQVHPVPTAVASRIKMLPDIPKARKVLEKYGATDLAGMLFGDDAEATA